MAIANVTTQQRDVSATKGATSDLLTKNWMTTAGILTGAGVGVTSVLVTATALPAQVLGMTAVSGGLIYFGARTTTAEIADRKSANEEVAKEHFASRETAEAAATT